MRTRIRTTLLALVVLFVTCLATAQADVEVGVEASTRYGVSVYSITEFFIPLEDGPLIDVWLLPEVGIYRGTTFRAYARTQLLIEFDTHLTIGIAPIVRIGAWEELAIRAYARFSK